MPAQFRAPPEEELTELARKWVAVERLVTEEYGAAITTDVSTLALLQRVVDDDLVDAGYGAQCLGAVLGRVMAANIPGLDWALVEDEHGTDVCLRYADTSLCIFPITMISKRVERGEAVDVSNLYDETSIRIAGLANDVD